MSTQQTAREINSASTMAPDFEIPIKNGKPVVLPVSPSATRWIWQALRDIDLKGPNGQLKLFGKGEKFYDKIERGKVYPLFDIWTNKKLPPDGQAGNSLDVESGTSTQLRDERVTHFAYDCGEDFKMTYGDITGGVVFESLTGLTREQVQPLLAVVLPTIFNQLDRRGADKAGTWLGDLMDLAPERIKQSKLDDINKKRADQLRREALMGLNVAIRVAGDSRQALMRSMALASIGREGQARADEYDEAMAELLGLAVPTTIAAEPAQEMAPQAGTSDAVLNFIIQTQEREAARDAELKAMREEMQAMRGGESLPQSAGKPPKGAGGRFVAKDKAADEQAPPEPE